MVCTENIIDSCTMFPVLNINIEDELMNYQGQMIVSRKMSIRSVENFIIELIKKIVGASRCEINNPEILINELGEVLEYSFYREVGAKEETIDYLVTIICDHIEDSTVYIDIKVIQLTGYSI